MLRRWSVFRRAVPVIGVVVVTTQYSSPRAHVTETTGPAPVTQNPHPFGPSSGVDIPAARKSSPLKIQNIRLEPVTNPDATPSSSLKFDVINHGTSGLTNIVLEISILEHRRHAESDGPPRVLVQPFMIRETVVLQPGYSMEYELRLRNLSADDGGEARVAVVSLESRPDSR